MCMSGWMIRPNGFFYYTYLDPTSWIVCLPTVGLIFKSIMPDAVFIKKYTNKYNVTMYVEIT